MNKPKVASVYVSHHSGKYINKFGHRHKDELGGNVYVVNSSDDVPDVDEGLGFTLIDAGKNVGFAAATNAGIDNALRDGADYFIIVNPDILLPFSWLEETLRQIYNVGDSNVGIFTVPLYGYDFESDKATGLLDSLGIYSTWYGRWYDHLAGHPLSAIDTGVAPYTIPAACGALMIVPRCVIESLLNHDGYVFNESYFMYKEDIELSVRVRRQGKKILMLPAVPAYHCRGWDGSRNSPYLARYLSARNELSMHLKYCRRFVLFSALKYIYVRFIEKS